MTEEEIKNNCETVMRALNARKAEYLGVLDGDVFWYKVYFSPHVFVFVAFAESDPFQET